MSMISRLLASSRWHPPAAILTPPGASPPFSGQTILVTGANTGLGLASAIHFAKLGAKKLILGVRDLSKGEAAKQAILREAKGVRVVVSKLDMLDYESIKAFAEDVEIELGGGKLDVAVLNAGLHNSSFRKSAYGYEEDVQVNVLGTTLLALLLLPIMHQASTAGGGRTKPKLIVVGSGMHYNIKLSDEEKSGEVDLLEMLNNPEGFTAQRQYGISKLLVMYAVAAITQLPFPSTTADKTTVQTTVVCPGMCYTEITRGYSSMGYRLALWLASFLLLRSPEEGSRTYVSGALLGEEGQGSFWQNDRIREPAPLLQGDVGERLQKKAWYEIVIALRRDVPEVEALLRKQEA